METSAPVRSGSTADQVRQGRPYCFSISIAWPITGRWPLTKNLRAKGFGHGPKANAADELLVTCGYLPSRGRQRRLAPDRMRGSRGDSIETGCHPSMPEDPGCLE